MPGKTAGSREGLGRQIDELDALLDRLLELPLGPAPEPPALPALKIAEPGDSLLEVMDESLELDMPILRIPTRDEEARTAIEDQPSKPRLASLTSEFGTFPHLGNEHLPTDQSVAPAILPLQDHSPTPINRLEESEIPWLGDEPGASPQNSDATSPSRPLAPMAGSGAGGPRVEIVQGSLNTAVMSSDGITVIPKEIEESYGLARRAFIAWTWLFDSTVGHFLPGLARRRGKRLLVFVGLCLLGTSLFLAWKWWLP